MHGPCLFHPFSHSVSIGAFSPFICSMFLLLFCKLPSGFFISFLFLLFSSYDLMIIVSVNINSFLLCVCIYYRFLAYGYHEVYIQQPIYVGSA